MGRVRSLPLAAVAAALLVALGIPAAGADPGSGGDAQPPVYFGAAPVLALNVRPIATPDAYATSINTVLLVAAPGLLLNDIDPNGDPLLAIEQAGAQFGSVVLATNGGFTYTPPLNWVGIDTFRYCAQDQDSCSNVIPVTITVSGTPPLPTPTATPLPTASLPLPTPSPSPGATPTPTPSPSFDPGPSGSPAPSPSAAGPGPGGGAGPVEPSSGPPASGGSTSGGRAEVDLAPSSRGAGPAGGFGSPLSGVTPNLEWAVPAVALAFPGLLVLIVGAAQALGGAAWLPIVRRALRGTGVAKAHRRYRYIVRTTE